MVTKLKPLKLIDKLYLGIILIVFGGIVLHAPATVWLGTVLPDYAVSIKAWKEILILVALVISVFLMVSHKKLDILRRPIVILMVAYGLLHILYVAFSGLSADTLVAGLMIDLRYIAYFLVVLLASELYPSLRRLMLKIGLAGALVVFVFAVLQVFVLPIDVLSTIGYGRDTIAPYLTVDQNMDYIRINSTLRGPNPLGAYATIGLTLMGSWLIIGRHKLSKKSIGILGIAMFEAIITLWFSYSRSALLASVLAVGMLALYTYHRLITRKVVLWGVSTIALLVLVLSIGLSGSSFVTNVVLHENPDDNNSINSNDGHAESLDIGLSRLIAQPFGAGIGTTGSPSLEGDKPFIVENQYFYVAHEVGWIGLGIFMAIYLIVMRKLWDRRRDWLSSGLFFSGLGLFIIGLLLPVWVDDTVSIVWWGLAGLALGGVEYKHRMNIKNGN